MKHLPELLAPAGGPQQLKAAVENGADAVYLGLKQLNARQNAENFDGGQIREAIAYAHVRGVNVYIALNTLVTDAQLPAALELAALVYEAGADALIVQDLGLAALLRRRLADLPLHLSTQGSIYNLEGVQMAAKLGFSRVVLARELSAEEIRHITAHAPIETEIFVHGALCVAYSGQCLLSSLIGGRSGNRGDCAQPCRLPYRLAAVDAASGRRRPAMEECHLLSPKDLCLLPRLDEVIQSGAASLKLEGRAKSPEYTAVVTRLYRTYLDRYQQGWRAPEEKDIRALAQIFNRGGFTTGYLKGKQGFAMIAAERSKHGGVYIGKILKAYPGKKMVDIQLDSRLSIGDGIEILADGLPGNIVTSMLRAGERAACGQAGEVVRAGYIQGRIPPGAAVYKISEREQLKEARASFEQGYNRKRPVKLTLTAHKGQRLRIFAQADNARLNNTWQKPTSIYIESNEICESALTRPLTEQRAREQLLKTGNTPFSVSQCTVDIDEDAAVALSVLNALRRKALTQLEERLSDRYPHRQQLTPARPDWADIRDAGQRPAASALDDTESKPAASAPADAKAKPNASAPDSDRQKPLRNTAPKTSLYFFQWSGEDRPAYRQADRLYLPYASFLDTKHRQTLASFHEQRIELIAAFPAITKGRHDQRIRENVYQLAQNRLVDGFMIGNLGHLLFCRASGKPVYADCSLNVLNAYTALVLGQLGIRGLCLSYELSEPLSAAREALPEQEAVIGGKVPAMYSEYCPASCCCRHAIGHGGTGGPKQGLAKNKKAHETYEVIDRKSKSLELVTDCSSCTAVIFGADEIETGRVRAIHKAAAGSWRINITRGDKHGQVGRLL